MKKPLQLSILLLILAFAGATPSQAQTSPPVILDMQKRAEVRNAWLAYRLDQVVPALMRRELNVTVQIPEWNKDIRIMLEEDAFFDGDSVRYIDGRQTELWLIPRQ